MMCRQVFMKNYLKKRDGKHITGIAKEKVFQMTMVIHFPRCL